MEEMRGVWRDTSWWESADVSQLGRSSLQMRGAWRANRGLESAEASQLGTLFLHCTCHAETEDTPHLMPFIAHPSNREILLPTLWS